MEGEWGKEPDGGRIIEEGDGIVSQEMEDPFYFSDPFSLPDNDTKNLIGFWSECVNRWKMQTRVRKYTRR